MISNCETCIDYKNWLQNQKAPETPMNPEIPITPSLTK